MKKVFLLIVLVIFTSSCVLPEPPPEPKLLGCHRNICVYKIEDGGRVCYFTEHFASDKSDLWCE